MFKKFFSKLSEREKFDSEVENIVSEKGKKIEKVGLNAKINEIFGKYEDFSNLKSKSFEEIDKIFINLIKDLKELFEYYRGILGSEVMKNPNLVELNQLTFGLDKNKTLLYREEFNLEEFLKYELILIEQIRKLE